MNHVVGATVPVKEQIASYDQKIVTAGGDNYKLVETAGNDGTYTYWLALIGSEENPWLVGVEGHEDEVTAYINGAGGVVIKGTGPMKDFTVDGEGAKPWPDTIRAIKVGKGVTTLGDYMLYGCNQVWCIEIAEGLEPSAVSEHAFDGIAGFPPVKIPVDANGKTMRVKIARKLP